jgi:hypothetical protein
VHDKLPERRWHYVPIWNIPVYLWYAPRRVICPVNGAPTVEAMPWNLGKSPYAESAGTEGGTGFAEICGLHGVLILKRNPSFFVSSWADHHPHAARAR